jgi:ATP/maltotriose-dependent transcriptional regulator MalT
LGEAIEHQVLAADEIDHGYRFRHALTRDAIYSDTLPRERVRVHRAYAEALSADPSLAGSPASAAAALAVHWAAAYDAPRALAASIDAARLAAPYAPAEALRHLERALELWPGVADATARCGIDLVELLRMAAVSAYAAGNLEQSLALYDEALTELGGSGAGEREALLLDGKATSLTDLGRDAEASDVLEHAATLLPSEPPTVARAVVLVSLASRPLLGMLQDSDVWRRDAEEALEASRAAGAREQEATARIILGPALAYGGQPEQGVAEMRAGLELAQALGEPALALRGYLNLSDTLELIGRHQEAADEAARGLQLAARVGLTRHVYGLYLVNNRAESLIALGRWGEADQLLSEALELGLTEAAVSAGLTMRRATIAALTGRWEDAARDVEAASNLPAVGGVQYTMPLAFARALVASEQGDTERPREIVRDALATPKDMPLSDRYRWPLIWFGLRIEAESGDADTARVAALRAETAEVAAIEPSARAFQALAAAELARITGTRADWADAVEAARQAGDLYLLAYALLRSAQDACAAGDRDDAGPLLDESARLSAQLGAEPLLAEAQALARRARLRIPDGASSEPQAGPSSERTIESFGLTDRERAVLELVAVGRSNPQIATELFISPKTASVHVSNILSKLNVSSRGEAAALAHRLGLGLGAPAAPAPAP